MGLTTWTSPNGQRVTMHRDAVPMAEPFFKRLHELHPEYQSLGGHAVRPMRTLDGRNLGGLSSHASGYTLDIKAPDNVLRQLAQEFPQVRWGGNFKSHYDPVHFEFKPGAAPIGAAPSASPAPGGGLSGASPPMALSNAYVNPQEQPGYLDRVLNSPLFMMGASVLGAPNIGTGLMQGSQAASQGAMARERLANERAMMPLKQMMLQAQLAQGQQQADIARENMDMRRAEFAESQQMTPLKRQLMEAQVRAAGQKDVLNEAIAQMIAPAGSAPMPPMVPSPVRPQSMQGAEQDPNLIRTQVGGQAQAQQEQPDMVDTPMGPMPLKDAQRRAFALGLAGKGDAGKMLMDSAQQGKLGKEAGNQNDKDQMAAIEAVARLDGIVKSFDPKHLEIPNRIEQQFRSLQNKAGGWLGKPTPEQQQELMKFAQFKQQSVKNAALYVKYLSGVAVSEAEFARIMQTLPNAGTGMFDGDSAPEFAAKMQQAVKDSRAAIARANYLRTKGFAGKPWEAGVGLDDVPALIDQRGQIIEQSLRQQNPNADPRQIQEGVRRQLKQEFGI